jgi:protein tyrosine phosphatase (PTP) superfamily phosphohydrolase (DUF442 family)
LVEKKANRGRVVAAKVLVVLTGLAAAALAAEATRVFALGNFHAVAENRLYRCSQPGADRVRSLARDHRIRTIINLRGCCDPSPWYLEEAKACQELDINLEDLAFSATRLPSTKAFRELVDLLDTAEEPILIHCHRGIDRTGLACALWKLLKTNEGLDAAYWQLGARFGHFRFGRTAHMDEALDMYADWLASRQVRHSPEVIREFVRNHYCPGHLRAGLDWSGPWPPVIQPEKPSLLRVRATNNSVATWRFSTSDNAGVHLSWRLLSSSGASVASGMSGMFERRVPPGGSIDLDISLPGLACGERYRLLVDMTDPQHATFLQAGGEVLEGIFDVGKAGS